MNVDRMGTEQHLLVGIESVDMMSSLREKVDEMTDPEFSLTASFERKIK